MKITLIFTPAVGPEQGITVDSYWLSRTEGKIRYTIGKDVSEYDLKPGDKVDVYAVGYTTTIKRNKQ